MISKEIETITNSSSPTQDPGKVLSYAIECRAEDYFGQSKLDGVFGEATLSEV